MRRNGGTFPQPYSSFVEGATNILFGNDRFDIQKYNHTQEGSTPVFGLTRWGDRQSQPFVSVETKKTVVGFTSNTSKHNHLDSCTFFGL